VLCVIYRQKAVHFRQKQFLCMFQLFIRITLMSVVCGQWSCAVWFQWRLSYS
jgi:hypothetical protein